MTRLLKQTYNKGEIYELDQSNTDKKDKRRKTESHTQTLKHHKHHIAYKVKPF